MTIDLEKLEDSELIALAARAGELLEERKQRRRQEALEQARATLERAGLSVRDLAQTSRRPTRSKPTMMYRAGFRYRHPDDAGREWAGRGQKPKWLRELERRNVRPIELAAQETTGDRVVGVKEPNILDQSHEADYGKGTTRKQRGSIDEARTGP